MKEKKDNFFKEPLQKLMVVFGTVLIFIALALILKIFNLEIVNAPYKIEKIKENGEDTILAKVKDEKNILAKPIQTPKSKKSSSKSNQIPKKPISKPKVIKEKKNEKTRKLNKLDTINLINKNINNSTLEKVNELDSTLISGIVKDERGNLLSGVNISEFESKNTIIGTTNKDGEFEIKFVFVNHIDSKELLFRKNSFEEFSRRITRTSSNIIIELKNIK